MATVPEIFDALGGHVEIASAISVPLTTVHSWKRSGYVPTWRIPALIALAETRGETLTAAEFPPKPVKLANAA
jgi:hypothetical protein